MKKYFVLFLLLCISSGLFAQKITKVTLRESEKVASKKGVESIMIVTKPVFEHDNSILSCDSAFFYTDRNTFDAFGNVHINQGDSLNIYSDLLNYNGNTKIAILTNNVRMIDKGAVLTTNYLHYNMATKIGHYTNGGKIVNGPNTIVSKNAYYFSNSNDAYFRYDVKVTSPEILIESDTLRYNSFSKITYFYGPTKIHGKDDLLYTENGTYNTATDQAAFGKRNLYTQNSKSLKGDSLFYDRNAGYGRAVKNIVFKDTVQNFELRGHLGVFNKADESIVVTKNPYVVLATEKDSVSKDSIWLSADTLSSKVLTKGQLYVLKQARLPKIEALQDSLTVNDLLPVTDSLKTDSLSIDSTIVDKINNVDTLVKEEVIKPVENLSKKALKKAAKKKKQEKVELKRPDTPGVSKSDRPRLEGTIKVPEVDSIEIKKQLRNQFLADSIIKDSIRILSTDTAKVRVVNAWRNVKIFKSDLQAKSDSAFFSYGDSTLRIYQSPMLWSQNSQMAADTMYLQMKSGKLDNMDLIKNAIVVNTRPDSLYYNQIAGKTMKGFFLKDKLDRVFVDGNAESIYFPEDSTENGAMMRTLCSRMKIIFRNDSLESISFLRKPEMTYYPVAQLTEELKTLPNFSWKPKDRPKSKNEVIGKLVSDKPKAPVKTTVAKKTIEAALPKKNTTNSAVKKK